MNELSLLNFPTSIHLSRRHYSAYRTHNPTGTYQDTIKQTVIMAEGGGIDRKAEERMEFNTSKEVTVHPTFESMSLKGKADLTVQYYIAASPLSATTTDPSY